MIEASEVREWAQDNGLAVGVRGRMSVDVWVAYLAAHPSDAKEVARTIKGLNVPKRGRMSDEARKTVALALR